MLIGAELAALYTGWAPVRWLAATMVLFLPVMAWNKIKLREIYLLALCGALFIGACVFEKPLETLIPAALSNAAFLAGFILLMALLREGAMTSRSVLAIGSYLTQQPTSWRFFSIFSGSHFLSVMISMGSLTLFAPIIQRGVRAYPVEGEELSEELKVQERRQLTAAFRGFSWFLVWAPTAVTQAVMPTLMDGINHLRLMAAGIVLAFVMLMVSWLEDMLTWRGLAEQNEAPESSFPISAFRNFSGVCLALFSFSILFMQLFGVTIITGVMLTAPLVVVLWVKVQQRSQSADKNRLQEIAFTGIPGYTREAVFAACAGFIGTLAGKIVPAAEMAHAFDLAFWPGWLLLLSLSLCVWFFGQLGLSPITMAIFLASLISEIPALPVDMAHAALAIAAGTAICTYGAPFSAGAIMLSRATGYPASTLTWRWNGAYFFVTIPVLAIFYALLMQA